MTCLDTGYRTIMPMVEQLLDGRYRLTEQIAAGGMGQVWRATDEMLRRTVAVKLLREGGGGERFRTEARAMAALHHPGVADVYDYGEASPADGTSLAYIVMACVEGQPLSDRIAGGARLGAAETMAIVAQTAEALQVVHEAGVVHRDVKPGNLIIEPDGHVVLIDFGVAVTPEAVGLTAVHEVVGTALYMAPEQVSKQEITPATDVYALGAVAYHCLAGHPPYVGDNALVVALRHLDDEPPPLPDNLPADVRQLVAVAMAKDPAQRFPSASAMAAAAYATGAADRGTTVEQPVAALASSLPPAAAPPRPSRSRRRTAVITVLAGVAALVAAVALADPSSLLRGPFGGTPAPAATAPAGDPAESGGGPAGGTAGEVGPGTGPSRGQSAGPGGATASPGGSPAPSATGGPGPAPTPSTPPGGGGEPTGEPSAEPTGEPTPDPTGETSTDPQLSPQPAPTGQSDG